MKQGDQIAYVPDHADGPEHPDCEYGFVMSLTLDKKGAFCRYWVKEKPGVLRTVANSERTEWKNLVNFQSTSQYEVNRTIATIKSNPEYYGYTREEEFDDSDATS